jgi:prevent-host-death family protein
VDKRIGAAEAKAHLSALIAEVAYGGVRIVIERRGRPLAALVGLDDLARLVRDSSEDRPRGALALVGAWDDVGDDVIDDIVEDIYAQRDRDSVRPVEIPE